MQITEVLMKAWRSKVACPDGPLAGTRLLDCQETAFGVFLDVDVAAGRLTPVAARRLEVEVANALDLPVGSLWFEPLMTGSEGRVRIHVIHPDVVSEPREFVPIAPRKIRLDALPLGPYVAGRREAVWPLMVGNTALHGVVAGPDAARAVIVARLVAMARATRQVSTVLVTPSDQPLIPELKRYVKKYIGGRAADPLTLMNKLVTDRYQRKARGEFRLPCDGGQDRVVLIVLEEPTEVFRRTRMTLTPLAVELMVSRATEVGVAVVVSARDVTQRSFGDSASLRNRFVGGNVVAARGAIGGEEAICFTPMGTAVKTGAAASLARIGRSQTPFCPRYHPWPGAEDLRLPVSSLDPRVATLGDLFVKWPEADMDPRDAAALEPVRRGGRRPRRVVAEPVEVGK